MQAAQGHIHPVLVIGGRDEIGGRLHTGHRIAHGDPQAGQTQQDVYKRQVKYRWIRTPKSTEPPCCTEDTDAGVRMVRMAGRMVMVLVSLLPLAVAFRVRSPKYSSATVSLPAASRLAAGVPPFMGTFTSSQLTGVFSAARLVPVTLA